MIDREIWTLVGYAGSTFVVFGIMQTKIKRLRLLSATGASILALYAFMIGAIPVFLLNCISASLSLFYLIRMSYQKDYFLLNDTMKGGEFFLENFLHFYKDEILKFFPDFDFAKIKNPQIYLISRKLNPVGLFIYEDIGLGRFQVHLDFATPEYRDFKNFLFIIESKQKHWVEKGFHTMVVENPILVHQRYLIKMGFHLESKAGHRYVKSLSPSSL